MNLIQKNSVGKRNESTFLRDKKKGKMGGIADQLTGLMKNKLVRAAKNEKVAKVDKTIQKAPHSVIPESSFKKGRGEVTMIHGSTKQKATGPTSRIELFVSAKNLTDLDTFTLSDPVCTLKVKNSKLGGYISYGETEVVDNNLNPKWVDHF